MIYIEDTYGSLRADVLARCFPLSKFYRANHFSNINILGQIGTCFHPTPGGKATLRLCFTPPCVPRRNDRPIYDTDATIVHNVSEVERWRVWNHDRTNALTMTGLRLIQLCVDHRAGDPLARSIITAALKTTEALFKYPADSDFDGYIIRWDPVADDDWVIQITDKGNVSPIIPCRFLVNTNIKKYPSQHYLYCTPLDDLRYRKSVDEAIQNSDNEHRVLNMEEARDRYRRWEPSKDEYNGLLAGLVAVFESFSSSTQSEDQELVKSVKRQVKRIARYLQNFSYTIVRPDGGFANRGCGELLPLFEFPYNRVFERILGQRFDNPAHPIDVLVRAKVSLIEILGSARILTHDVLIKVTQEIRDELKKQNLPDLPGGDDLLKSMSERQARLVVSLWQNREAIDVKCPDTQGEVFIAFLLNSLPRDARRRAFETWMASSGKDIACGFKPYIALMLLHDSDNSIRVGYLKWYKSTFNEPDPGNLTVGDYDWAFATAVALLVAKEEGDNNLVQSLSTNLENQINSMASQLYLNCDGNRQKLPMPLIIAGAGASPLQNEEMANHDGLSCGRNSPVLVASETQDKVGNWYGFMAALSMAWKYILDYDNNPFSENSGICRPHPMDWPIPKVQTEVIVAARNDPVQMIIPLSAISISNRTPDGDTDIPLFMDPPDRADDNHVGNPIEPIGRMDNFDFRGNLFTITQFSKSWDYPALSADQDPDHWEPAPNVEEDNYIQVGNRKSELEDGKFTITGYLLPPKIEWVPRLFGIRIPHITIARYSGTVSLAWAWTP